MTKGNTCTGLVLCGGQSSRMGTDKSMISYHGQPQRFHLYDMLVPFCREVFISCTSQDQVSPSTGRQYLIDLPYYSNTGPAGALLTAFERLAPSDLLVIGCDYPLLARNDIDGLIQCSRDSKRTAAFFNEQDGFYEPTLGYYRMADLTQLLLSYTVGDLSLQQLLRKLDAAKYIPLHPDLVRSVDDPVSAENAKALLAKMNL